MGGLAVCPECAATLDADEGGASVSGFIVCDQCGCVFDDDAETLPPPDDGQGFEGRGFDDMGESDDMGDCDE